MTALDPYRTLGLAPGATPAEVKRAYRRLAKQYHPDSAGERTLQHFLAIQAAYEALGGSAGAPRPGTSRPAGPGQPGPARPAWQADPERSRATREAYRARTRRASAPGDAPGAAGSAGRKASGGARPPGESAAPGGRPGGRESRRPKATIGSTSYDGADREPFDPTWEGGDWYGAGSGTYWTLNPKEYADPRKHGPEYQARSRRGRAASGQPPPAGDEMASPGPEQAREPTQEDAPDRAPGPTRPPHAPAPRPSPRRTSTTAPPARGVPTVPGRMLLAFIGWIPLAVGLSAASSSLPACGGDATLCGDPLAAGGTWFVHLAVVAILLAVPRLAWIAASGSLAFIAAGLFGTPALLAFGGAQTPGGTSAALSVVLVVGWLVGVGFALSGRLALPPWRPARVR